MKKNEVKIDGLNSSKKISARESKDKGLPGDKALNTGFLYDVKESCFMAVTEQRSPKMLTGSLRHCSET